ncbi:unnamed protein product [Urochloa decumbens]|uniref:Peptidase A1 domain-containing protein n=1 Tax=Urochloa decumbens TaxID=240449 RepID=A0ABC9D6A1_9POAL
MSLPLLALSLLLLSPPGALAGDGYPPSSKPILTPISKDASRYTIPIKNGAPLVLDLAGPLVWTKCPPPLGTDPCKNGVCAVAAETLSANATDGKNPLYPVSFPANVACAPDSMLAPLPSGAAGVAGLARMPMSLPSQVASRLKVSKQFALCLPGGGQTGAAIFGGGPFQLLASPPVELAEGLRQNPIQLVDNPRNGGYYIRLHGISVNMEPLALPAGAFDLDARHGTGGVVFSTVTPYTTLRPDIYRALRDAFERVTSGIPRAPPVAPFEMCYHSSAFGYTRLGPGVANIDLVLDRGRIWQLPGGSSLVGVNDQTLCFAFLEMGSETAAAVPGSPAVIIGGYQLEDHLLLFDLEKGTLGLSGLLLGIRTTCGNFNFTMGSS